ncbi:hypothetical protein ACUIJP_04010 [Leuconostoc pseudomesenteroides]|jgi:hypothetical protein|uniref:hypothetical protein n=1 Tax=Leuconostoc pseudomesenteroides TaxID=33968 RepID=UPI00403D66CD
MIIKDKHYQTLNIPAGYFGLVTMTTQAGFEIEVSIVDTKTGKSLFHAVRKSNNPNPVITAQFLPSNDNPELIINVKESAHLDVRYDEMNVTDENGLLLSQNYVFVAEDATDKDYNDLYLAVAAWRYRN